jgi:hypothetical protein
MLAPVFLLAWMAIASADWDDCLALEYRRDRDVWRIIGNALWTLVESLPLAAATVAAPLLPAAAAVALAKRRLTGVVALAPTLFLVCLTLTNPDPASLHDCDRKGCKGCLGIALGMLMLKLPVGAAVLIGVGARRLWPLLRHESTA